MVHWQPQPQTGTFSTNSAAQLSAISLLLTKRPDSMKSRLGDEPAYRDRSPFGHYDQVHLSNEEYRETT